MTLTPYLKVNAPDKIQPWLVLKYLNTSHIIKNLKCVSSGAFLLLQDSIILCGIWVEGGSPATGSSALKKSVCDTYT